MKIDEIRNMSDAELRTFLNHISQRNCQLCSKCGRVVMMKNERIGLFVYKEVENRKLCTICKECYGDLLDYLGVSDIK